MTTLQKVGALVVVAMTLYGWVNAEINARAEQKILQAQIDERIATGEAALAQARDDSATIDSLQRGLAQAQADLTVSAQRARSARRSATRASARADSLLAALASGVGPVDSGATIALLTGVVDTLEASGRACARALDDCERALSDAVTLRRADSTARVRAEGELAAQVDLVRQLRAEVGKGAGFLQIAGPWAVAAGTCASAYALDRDRATPACVGAGVVAAAVTLFRRE